MIMQKQISRSQLFYLVMKYMTAMLVTLVVMLVVVVVVVVRTSNIGDLASLVKEIDVLGKSQVVVPHYQPGQYECTHNTSHLLLLGKSEYTGGPIFKVVLEC